MKTALIILVAAALGTGMIWAPALLAPAYSQDEATDNDLSVEDGGPAIDYVTGKAVGTVTLPEMKIEITIPAREVEIKLTEPVMVDTVEDWVTRLEGISDEDWEAIGAAIARGWGRSLYQSDPDEGTDEE